MYHSVEISGKRRKNEISDSPRTANFVNAWVSNFQLANNRLKEFTMDRRTILTSASAIAAAGVLAGAAQAHGKETTSKTSFGLDKTHADCLKACQDCAAKCNESVHYCMDHLSQGKKDHAACAALAMSCQEFCSLSAQLIARSCMLAPAACKACETACDACASECEKVKADEQMIACAKACRQCAESCRMMIK